MADFDRAKLRKELQRDESRRPRAYLDCCGRPWRMCECKMKGQLTIGVGWNLDANGLPEDVIDLLVERSIEHAIETCDAIEPLWTRLDDARRRVVLNMAMNLGTLRFALFKRFWSALRDYIVSGAPDALDAACAEMKASVWAIQVGSRADRLIEMMRSGDGL